MEQINLYKKTEQYVTKLFHENENPKLVYHNIHHTKYVVDKANEIAGHYHLDEKEMEVIFIASWFHDIGYLFTEPGQHEEKSIEIMRTFLRKHDAGSELEERVAGCINATKQPRHPSNICEEILCDADTYNLGTKDFKESNKLVFKEMQLLKEVITRDDFDEATLKMMEEHVYFTSYCKELLSGRKKKNMKKLKKNYVKEELKEGPGIDEKQGTTKGMQTLLRLTSSNHMQLSDMADHKANILLSVNSIIISVILSVLLRRLSTETYLIIPTMLFLLSSVITIIIAILATRPKMSMGTFNDDDIINKKTNLLFFGNFHRVPQEKYQRAMRTMVKDPDYLYSSIIQDIYQLGTVLGKKYKLIRIAYNIFMVGLILSVIAFAFAAVYSHGTDTTVVTNNSNGSPF